MTVMVNVNNGPLKREQSCNNRHKQQVLHESLTAKVPQYFNIKKIFKVHKALTLIG